MVRDRVAVRVVGGRATVFMGQLAGARSPARAFSPILGADVTGGPERRIAVPLLPDFEHALVLLAGGCRLDGQALAADTLYYLGCGRRELVCRRGGQPQDPTGGAW